MQLKTLLAGAALICASGAAHAAVITQGYKITASNFSSHGIAPVVFNVVLTYDPTVTVTDKAVDSYSSNSSYAAFSPGPVYFNYLASYQQFQIGGPSTSYGSMAASVVPGQNDFYIGFIDNGTSISSAIIGSTTATTDDNSYTFNVTVERVAASSAAPEPASWAMMVGGFGLTGAALRRRKRVAVRFA